jgi:hypothetical protein
MKKAIYAALFGLALMAAPTTASAHEYDRDDSDHPLRYVAYALHPVGIALEYVVLRPIHWFVSKDPADKVFGHEPREEPDHNYMEWK